MGFLKSKLFLILALVGFGLAGAFYFSGGFVSGDIGLNVLAPEKAPRLGEPFDLKVGFSNNSRVTMKDVRLGLKFPEGAVSFNGESRAVEERSLGEIRPGGVHEETFRVVGVPNEGKNREFKITASYSPESLVARFEKSKNLTVSFQEGELTLELKAPTKVFAGEEFEMNLEYKKPEDDPLNYSIKMEYPESFVLTDSTLEPTESNNTWKIIGGAGKLNIRGKVDLPDETAFTVKAQIVSGILGKSYVFVSKSSDISIAESPLSLKISLADQSKNTYYPGETLNYILNYKNNTQVELQGLILRAQLIGLMYNFQTLKGQGIFNAINSTITWDSKSLSELKSVGPGGNGSVNFSVNLKESYPIRRLNDKNFVLKVNAKIESPTVPYLISSDKTISSAVLENKVGGKITVESKGYFRDAGSGILNSGPLPPKVGSPTDFTVHLVLTNFSTDVVSVEVRVPLQDGVVFTDKVKGNTSSLPEFSETGEIVWKIDKLFATSGITGEHPEAIFQIRATPRSNHSGNYMPLLGETRIGAHDEFTGVDLSSFAAPLTTRLQDDPTVSERDGIVVQ